MQDILKKLGIEDINPGGFCGEWFASGDKLDSTSPINGERIASVTQITPPAFVPRGVRFGKRQGSCGSPHAGEGKLQAGKID